MLYEMETENLKLDQVELLADSMLFQEQRFLQNIKSIDVSQPWTCLFELIIGMTGKCLNFCLENETRIFLKKKKLVVASSHVERK